ncbi:putative gustatory receptor 2a [Anopheles ziemanni]|uniref:putative gustatory receptor 2a n=1 Tax=Anopheles coustani TaxID=139045 RepID=UPI0026585CD5|nr:putative gustatory receptor 2a [Anopheles coustani]XP_058168910.1 putative gustatory receptor 2a [Anopheles ziemanni]
MGKSISGENFVLFILKIVGGPLGKSYSCSYASGRFIYTIILSSFSCALFTICMLDLRSMLYCQQDLVLSVIDLLLLLGIAFALFAIQFTTLVRYLKQSQPSIFQCLEELDGQLYALNVGINSSASFATNCITIFIVTTLVVITYLLSNVPRMEINSLQTVAFNCYGLFTIFLMHGINLVLCHQLRKRIRYMVVHLEKMIRLDRSCSKLARDLRSLAIVQTNCFKAVACLNDDCGLINVTLYALFFYVLTSKSFQLFYICSIQFKKHGFSVTDVLEPTALVVSVFSYFVAATHLGETVQRETQLVVNNLHKFESMLLTKQRNAKYYETNLSELVEQIGQQILHQPVCFTVMNFFQIDLKFFHLVMASVATYLIILLQFDFQS